MKNKIGKALFNNRFWKSVKRKEIPVNEWLRTKTLGLGLINFYLFIILNITGILLMFYYIPHTERAYQDIKDLQFVVSFGMIIRNMHRWSAYLMIVTVFLHMCRVFYSAEYREPRELNWVTGVFLFICTIALGMTGYFLPWDQKAYWGMTIMSSVMPSVPLIGEKIRYVVLGGTEVGQNGLIRSYVMHARVLPLALGLLMVVHFWRIRQDDFLAGSESQEKAQAFAASERLETAATPEAGSESWSAIIARESSKFLLALSVIMAASIFFNAPLEEMANPSVTPNPVKAPWFFLGMQELLSWGSPFWGAIVLPSLVIVFLILVPYMDRSRIGTGVWFHPSRRLHNILFTAFVVVFVGLIIIGRFMRGPNWVFYWPWEAWPIH